MFPSKSSCVKGNASVNPTAAEMPVVCEDIEAIQVVKEGTVAKTDRPHANIHSARPAGSLAKRILDHPKAVLGYSIATCSILVLLFYLGYYAARMDGEKPEYFGCREPAFASFSCGLWGINCRPFETNWKPFRCSGRCTLDKSISTPVVYGSGPYRADSWICRAAIHSGVISQHGGCGYYRFAGAATSFAASTANGISSAAFTSWFPKTVEFKAGASQFCTDLSWPILCLGVIFMFGFSLLPGTSAPVLSHLLVAWGFFYVRLAGQPASSDYASIIINSWGEIFILLAVSSCIYHYVARHTFSQWASLCCKQRVLLWGCCYVVPYHVLININMFDDIKGLNLVLGGFGSSDMTVTMYVVLSVLGLLFLVFGALLLRNLYRIGIWKKYLRMYLLVVSLGGVSWAMFPSTAFHLHHTMLGAVLLPFTRFPTRVAAFAQGALLGCFVHGYAAWGWSSYLDIPSDSSNIPVPADRPRVLGVTAHKANVTWAPLEGVTGYSLRLNSVEVYRGTETSTLLTGLKPGLQYIVWMSGIGEYGTNGDAVRATKFTTKKI